MEKVLIRLNKLYDEGENVLGTSQYTYSRSTHKSRPTTVDYGEFVKWQSKCVIFLSDLLHSEDYRMKKFLSVTNLNYHSNVSAGMSIIKALIEDIEEGNFIFKDTLNPQRDSDEIIENIFNKFHRISRQLRIRHNNRDTIEINDEYDVQDLLQALLLIDFEDVRKEEWTPSYAGTSSRMDFLIKDVDIVIETKMTRNNLKDKELGDQLIIDKERYATHPNCKKLYCFVYDKNELINNPVAVETDLSSKEDGFEVKVIIVPKF